MSTKLIREASQVFNELRATSHSIITFTALSPTAFMLGTMMVPLSSFGLCLPQAGPKSPRWRGRHVREFVNYCESEDGGSMQIPVMTRLALVKPDGPRVRRLRFGAFCSLESVRAGGDERTTPPIELPRDNSVDFTATRGAKDYHASAVLLLWSQCLQPEPTESTHGFARSFSFVRVASAPSSAQTSRRVRRCPLGKLMLFPSPKNALFFGAIVSDPRSQQ